MEERLRGTMKKYTTIIIPVKMQIFFLNATFKLKFKTKCKIKCMEVGVKHYITSENGMTNVKHFACKADIIS